MEIVIELNSSATNQEIIAFITELNQKMNDRNSIIAKVKFTAYFAPDRK